MAHNFGASGKKNRVVPQNASNRNLVRDEMMPDSQVYVKVKRSKSVFTSLENHR